MKISALLFTDSTVHFKNLQKLEMLNKYDSSKWEDSDNKSVGTIYEILLGEYC